MIGRLVLAVALAATPGCKGESAPAGRPPATTLSPAERALANDACGDYVRRLCACAETKPALADSCRLQQARPQAVALTVATIDDPGASADTVARAKRELAQVVGKCIEAAAQLPSLGCP